jgi:hypothetical protein
MSNGQLYTTANTYSTQGDTRNAYNILVKNGPLERPGVDGTMILKWTLKKEGVRVWTGLNWFGVGSSGGFCEHGNESLGPIKERTILMSLVTIRFSRSTLLERVIDFEAVL